MNISDDQYETLAALARMPTAPAVRHDRDDPGRAHRRADRAGAVVDGLRHAGVRRRRARRRRQRRSTPTRSVRSSSAASRGSRCSPATSTIPRPPRRASDGGWFLTGDRAAATTAGRSLLRRSSRRRAQGRRRERVDGRGRAGARRAPGRARGRRRRRSPIPSATRCRWPSSSPPIRRSRRPSSSCIDWCDERLAKSKRPRDITLVDELPRTSVGKIRKFLLQEPTARKRSLQMTDH